MNRNENQFLLSYFRNMQSQLPEEAVDILCAQGERLSRLVSASKIDAKKEYCGEDRMVSVAYLRQENRRLHEAFQMLTNRVKPPVSVRSELLSEFLTYALNAVNTLDDMKDSLGDSDVPRQARAGAKHVLTCALGFQDVCQAFEKGREAAITLRRSDRPLSR
jgi:hypothetical protein